jgi:hypothetical protein
VIPGHERGAQGLDSLVPHAVRVPHTVRDDNAMNLYATDPESHVLKSFIDSDGEFHYPFFLEFLLGQLAAAIRAEDIWTNLVERGSTIHNNFYGNLCRRASHVLKSFIDSDGEFLYPFFLEFLLGQLAAAIRGQRTYGT